ncbi:hypothetical protein HZB88_03465, partial [archaeon]|nr:hypothetical protein [archaeon]
MKRGQFYYCSASDDTNIINSITLYHNISGAWTGITTAYPNSLTGTLAYTAADIQNGTYIWNCQAVTSSEVKYAGSNSSFSIAVSGPLFSGAIPNQTTNEDTLLSNAFDLDSYFSGTDIKYTSSGNSSIIVAINSDNQVSFSASANWSGSENITFKASDSTSQAYSNIVIVTVTPVNDPPLLISKIPNQTNSNFTLSLADYFSDIDSNLTFSGSAPNFTVTINGSSA